METNTDTRRDVLDKAWKGALEGQAASEQAFKSAKTDLTKRLYAQAIEGLTR